MAHKNNDFVKIFQDQIEKLQKTLENLDDEYKKKKEKLETDYVSQRINLLSSLNHFKMQLANMEKNNKIEVIDNV